MHITVMRNGQSIREPAQTISVSTPPTLGQALSWRPDRECNADSVRMPREQFLEPAPPTVVKGRTS
jgi:hypothetical protein